MIFYVVIPVHNEEKTIGLTLDSIVNQTYLPKQVVVVNDNSTDNSEFIIKTYTARYPWIKLINSTSSGDHQPGSKVINAFYEGYNSLDQNFDIICKFDGDIILPSQYFQSLKQLYDNEPNIGIAGGLAYIKKDDEWIYENISKKDHVRGPFKSYRKQCFQDIGGLKSSIGWDTVDVLLAQYFNWKIKTVDNLIVKHLKPTGFTYSEASKYLQGEALYKMRYGIILSFITALKMASKKKSLTIFMNYIKGYFKAKSDALEFLVTTEQGKFIRKQRWIGMLKQFS